MTTRKYEILRSAQDDKMVLRRGLNLVSALKAPLPREHHGHGRGGFVAGLDDLAVPDRAAGVGHRGDPSPTDSLSYVAGGPEAHE
jgi:hypothetical protein